MVINADIAFAITIGAYFAGVAMGYIYPHKVLRDAEYVIAQCKLPLTRDMHCKLAAEVVLNED